MVHHTHFLGANRRHNFNIHGCFCRRTHGGADALTFEVSSIFAILAMALSVVPLFRIGSL